MRRAARPHTGRWKETTAGAVDRARRGRRMPPRAGGTPPCRQLPDKGPFPRLRSEVNFSAQLDLARTAAERIADAPEDRAGDVRRRRGETRRTRQVGGMG